MRKAQIERLAPSQRKQTLDQIKERCEIDTVGTVLESVESCPHCESSSLYRWGINAGIQQYKCKACHKTFNTLKDTPLARLRHKEKWSKFSQDIIFGKTRGLVNLIPF